MITAHKVELQLVAQGIGALNIPVIKAEIMETMYRGSRYTVELISHDTTVWNKIARTASKQQVTGALKWGVNRGSDQWCKTPRSFIVTNFKILSQQNVVHVTITGADSMFLLKNRASSRAFSRMTLDAIAKDIAEKANLNYEGGGATRQMPLLMQCGATDYEFLVESVLGRSGPVPFVLYCKNGNTLVFKQRVPGKPAFSLGYAASADVTVASMLSVISIDSSNYGTEVRGFDSAKRDANALLVEYLANDKTKPYDQFGGRKPEPLGSTPSRIQNVAITEPLLRIDDVLKQRADWDPPFTACRSYTRTNLLLQPELGDTIEVRGKTTVNEELFFTGNHQLYALYHYICPGQDSYTYLFLERRGVVEAQ